MEKGENEADASPLNPRGADKLCSAGGRGPDKPVTQVPPTTGYRQAVPVGGGPGQTGRNGVSTVTEAGRRRVSSNNGHRAGRPDLGSSSNKPQGITDKP